jgi:hypothetical protein
MDVNEPGGERKTAAIDDFVRVAVGTVADQGNPAVDCCDICRKWRGAGSVINPGMRENRVYQRLA